MLGVQLCWAGTLGLAQPPVTTIRGVVQDLSGKPVQSAEVIASNLETRKSHVVRTDEEGGFQLLKLAPGAYEFEVLGIGYRTQTMSGLTVRAGESMVLDFLLEQTSDDDPGEQAAENRQEQTTTGPVQIDESLLVGLPLNGRSYSQLATLQGQISDPFSASASRGVGSGNLTVAGGRATSNIFLLDGTNIMDSDNRLPQSAAGVQLGSDSILQVQIFSPQAGAEFGRGSGGVLNSITRSGTPQWHATLFEFFRNSKLDARNFFDAGAQPPPFKRNQFGVTATGPLIKDRTFLMGSYEGLRDRLTATEIDFFPDEKARQGIITDAEGAVLQTVEVAESVRPILPLFPLPNFIPSIGRGVGEHRVALPLPTDENFYSLRVDHRLSDRDSLFARYTLDDASSVSTQTAIVRQHADSRQQYLTLVTSHIFSPHTLGSFRFGYTRPGILFTSLPDGGEFAPELLFNADLAFPGSINVTGSTPIGPIRNLPIGRFMESLQYAYDMVLERQSHSLKLGVQVHRYRWDVSTAFNKGGNWSFASLESFLRAGEDGTANLGVALPGSNNRRDFRQTLVGLYMQDQYRVSANFQLSLGLRYEFTTLVKDEEGRNAFLKDLVRDSEPGIGPALGRNPSLRNISPRVGISWAPRGSRNTVLNGGFGIYYDQLLEHVYESQKNTTPFFNIAVRNSFDPSATFPDPVASAENAPLLVRTFDYQNTKTPTVLRYNLTLEHSLANWRLQADYVGARGNHLLRGSEFNLVPVPIAQEDGTLFFPPFDLQGPDNRINPNFGSIGYFSSDTQSFYNSAQLAVSRSFGSDGSVRASYRYGRSVDDASDQSPGDGQYGQDRTMDRALSDFDIRHRLSISYFYELPFGPGHRMWTAGHWGQFFGGWRLGGILSLRTGTPFSPALTVRTASFLFSPSRPNLRPGHSNNPTKGSSAGCLGVDPGQELGSREMYFDLCAYDIPMPGTPGNAGRNTIISHNVFNMDLSVQREFNLDSKRRLEFRAEFFNLPNHTNLDPRSGPPKNVFAGSSGRRNPIGSRVGATATTARQIQFALRVSF